MKKIVFTFINLVCLSLLVLAQAPPQRVCGTLEHHEYLKQTRPNYEAELNQYNQVIEQYLQQKAAEMAQNKTGLPSTASPTVIPVVVHVVYRAAVPATSITVAQAASQVQVLNDDFAKLNSDAVKVTQPTFSTVASGANIRFCLAQRDPNGNPTTGVDYKATTTVSFTTDDKVKSAATGGADPWDVTKYVNIWVCDLGSQLLGYGEFPTTSLSNTWGLVLHYKYTGSGGSAIAPYNLGRTGTHEFGHCFNLYHIWGDDGTACTGSDQVNDTPNQAGEHYGCFTAGSIQTDACSPSSPGVMWMNYMDYTDDACMYMFTAGQVARMEAVVSTAPWNVLQSSLGCTPVSALDANMASILIPVNGSSTCNNNVTPKITLSNSGSTTLTSATILYKMDAAATQTLNWTGSLASAASTVITLSSYTGLSTAAHTFSVWVTAPNGSTDQNTANDVKTSTFTVTSAPVGAALPFSEAFENTTFPPTGWIKITANTANAANTWTRVANTTGIPVTPATTACAKMDNFSGNTDITGQIDALRTPALSFAGANSTLRVRFDVSHRRYSATDIDTLNVYISTDCGGSWTQVYTKGGSQLATVTGTQTTAFTPTANAQWRRDSVNLGAYAGQPSVYLKFESRSGWGNNVYLDNINVNYTPANAAPTASFTSAAGKCAGTPITFSDQSSNAPTSWAWTFPGGTPASSTSQNPSVTYTASGTYTVTLTSANGTGTSTPVSQTIAVNAQPTVAVSSATVCSGTAANLTATGATTYSWSTGAATASVAVTPTTTTNYTVTGTTNGCSNTKTVSVTVNTTPTVAVNNATICSGTSANLTASGATTYSWNTGATTASITVTPTLTTNYTVTGTTNNCSNTKTVSVTVRTTPTVAVNSATVCSGTAANLTATGATTYSWNTGATTASVAVTPTANTNYTVTGTTNGCTNTKTVSVTVNATPTVAVNNATICSGTSANLTASGATTYSWNTGATTASIAVTPTATTNYTVTGTSNSCSNTKTVSVTVRTTPTLAVNSATVCSGTAANLTATGATTYSWNTGATTASVAVTPTANTNYTVTGTTNGCSNTKTVSVTVKTTPTVSVAGATVCAGTTVNLTASGATTYSWSTGATTASVSVSPTITTVYTVTGTTNGCSNTKTSTVNVNAIPNVSSTSSTICAGATATLTASGASTYSWNTGATGSNLVVSPSANTVYTVTGTSAAGCVKTVTASVVVGTAPAITVNSPAICAGESTTLTASGVSTYTWDSGSNNSTIIVTPSVTSTYSVSGNLVGCSTTASQIVTVTVNQLPAVTMGSITSPLCVNSPAENLTGTPAGGSFSGTGVSASTFDPAVSGSGTFTITYAYTDANNCSNNAVQTVSVSLCTGIAELMEGSVHIYPNPVKDAITIKVNSTLVGNTIMEMYDATGKLVMVETVSNELTVVPVNQFARGLYSIRMIAGGKQQIIHIVKE